MKNFILIFNIFTSITALFSQESMKKYVGAKSGLILRDEPSRKGKKIDKIPYGSEVYTIDQSQKKETIENVKAYWFQVSYKEKIGWVFGGYLLNIDPLIGGKAETISIIKFKLNNIIEYGSSEKYIKKILGNNFKRVNPNYECGFHSPDQGQEYYQLIYKDITFIGNDNEKFIIEDIKFKPSTNYELVYKSFVINYKTTLIDLFEYFGKSQLQKLPSDSVDEEKYKIRTSNMSDDAYIIIIGKDKKVKQIEYWSPC